MSSRQNSYGDCHQIRDVYFGIPDHFHYGTLRSGSITHCEIFIKLRFQWVCFSDNLLTRQLHLFSGGDRVSQSRNTMDQKHVRYDLIQLKTIENHTNYTYISITTTTPSWRLLLYRLYKLNKLIYTCRDHYVGDPTMGMPCIFLS